ncbi:amino acid adenylation domain-containing protein [Thalassospira xianhensis]
MHKQADTFAPGTERQGAPLTTPQASIWLDWAKGDDCANYNICSVIRFDGDLDIPALHKAIVQTDQENDALRLRFGSEGGNPFQFFADTCRETDYSVIDLSFADDPVLIAHHEVEEIRRRPLDPENGHHCRHRLLQLGKGRFWWVRVYHHLVCDGYAGHLMAMRAAEIYSALKSATPVPESTFGSYLDFITADTTYHETPAFQRDLAYWQERLKDDHTITRFSSDKPSGKLVQARLEQTLDGQELARLTQTAKACGTSPTAIVMAAYFILLGQITHIKHPTVTMPLLNRLGRAERQTPGAFSYIVPFDADLGQHARFSELARDIFARARRDVRHMRLGAPRMRAARLGARGLSGGGAFFNSLDGAEPLSFAGLDTRRVNIYNGPVTDLGLIYMMQALSPDRQEAEIIWQYDTACHDVKSVTRIAHRFRNFLSRALDDPEQEIATIAAPPLDELAVIRKLESGTAFTRPVPERLIPDRIQHAISSRPGDIALITDDGCEVTFATLGQMANAVAHHLHQSGIVAGDFVGMNVSPSAQQIATVIGILKCGAVCVQLDPLQPVERNASMTRHLDCRLVLSDSTDAWREIGNTTITVKDINTVPGIDGRTVLEDVRADICGDDIAFVFHTSGSTGQPKPVPVHHQSLADKIDVAIAQFGIGSHENGNPEIMGLFPSLGFDPWMHQFCVGLICGHRMWLMTHAILSDGHKFWNGVARHHVTHIMSVPSFYESVIDAIPADTDFKLRRLITGGEVIQPTLARRLYSVFETVDIWNCYGPTEATIHAATHLIPRDIKTKHIPLGRVDKGAFVRILDEDGKRVPLGVPGEIYLGGAGLNRGYINMPAVTAEKFVTDPTGEADETFYRSGDLASWGEDGLLYYHGRTDEQVKIRGQRIEIGEIEYRLSHVPGVGRGAVLYVKNNHGGELIGYLLPDGNPSKRPDIGTVRSELARHLSDAAVPTRLEWVETLPLLPSGKIDRKALAEFAQTPGGKQPVVQETSPPASRKPDQMRIYQMAEKIAKIWMDLIETDEIEFDTNLFEAGAHSLLVPRAQFALSKLAGRNIASVEIFQHPTINSFALHMCADDETVPEIAKAEPVKTQRNGSENHDIAIIGMAMRLPGADDRDAFWSILENGVDQIKDVDISRLRAMGGDPSALEDADFVARHGILDDIDMFDPAPFAMTAGETIETDPQQRLLLEVALGALEDGACDPARDGPVGAYVGVGFPTYLVDSLEDRLRARPDAIRYGMTIGNDKDFAATRLAYKLNLTGPAIASSTACSTGLVNIALAVDALRSGQCRVALAGGGALGLSPAGGYYFTQGGIGSRSGVCRPFDSKADGVVGGSGAAIVLLKRLDDAIADRDTIHAVIKGVGMNNDGSAKAAFTAPSVDGQAKAIQTALADARIDPATIRFVEGHGTATALGDPIEIAALNKVFAKTDATPTHPIWLGSVKGNIGHLDSAAGIAGLIKTVLAIRHRVFPPTCHFNRPNENLGLDQGPFRINNTVQPLENDGDKPLRAGVSSFGVGGTNAHIIIEEAPRFDEPTSPKSQNDIPHVLPFSAASEPALQKLLENTASWLDRNGSDIAISDVAKSLSRRHAYRFRTAIIATNIKTAISALTNPKSPARHQTVAQRNIPSITFLFPGQGSQRPGMAADLYEADQTSAALIRNACEQVARTGGPDGLFELLTVRDESPATSNHMARTEIAQPALFIYEYALANWLIENGISPAALAGHSIGEYVAACIGGIMSFDDALRLVVTRGHLMGQTEPGSMFALSMTEAEVGDLLSAFGPDLSMAAINGPRQCVVAGSNDCIDALEEHIKSQGKSGRRLVVSHAFHSRMMEPVLDEFRNVVAKIGLNAPTLPIQSNLTGNWLTAEDATNTDYWVQHLRNAVRFADNIKGLLAEMPETIMVECGFGNTASRLAIVNGTPTGNSIALQPAPGPDTTRNTNAAITGSTALAAAIARLWVMGTSPDWDRVNQTTNARRIPLPTYAFDRRRFWPDKTITTTADPKTFSVSAAPAETTMPTAQDAPDIQSDTHAQFTIQAVWRDMFGDPAIGPDDDFFELGGDSLFAVRIATRLSEVLNAEIPAAVMFEGRTVSGIAKLIASFDTNSAPTNIPPAPTAPLSTREQGVL